MIEVKEYFGSDINGDIIKRIKQIALNRYSGIIYNSNYRDVNSVEELLRLYDCELCNLKLFIGKDWFLFVEETQDYVKFLEWIASNNTENKVSQSIQMFKTLKRIIIKNSDKMFLANMRHDSSYLFYESLYQKNYINQIFHLIEIDSCYNNTPEVILRLKEKYNDLSLFLESDESIKHPEYLKYIIHILGFEVSKEYIKKQSKIRKGE